MSQVPPISSASSENSNVPSVNAWNNQAYDTSQMYSHQVAGQPFPQLQNWIYTGYPQNVPIIPGPQFPVQNLPPTVPPTQAAPQKFEDSDEEENDENEPPRKSPRLSNESKYLNLDANFQSNFFSPPTSFTQSTPKMTGVYTGANFNTPAPPLGLFSNYNPIFSPQNPYMTHQLQNSYTNTLYSSQMLTPQTYSSDSLGIHGSSSGMDSGVTGSSSSGTTNSSGASDLQLEDSKKGEFNVPGRLALLNSNQKYMISIGEINRRLGAPENMNTSLLGAMLRRAKNRNGGKKLRTDLQKYGINMPEGRRRSLENTAFTALCEAEAMNLARDLGQVLQQYFPAKLVLIEVALTIQRLYMQPTPLGQDLIQLLDNIESSDGDLEQQVTCIMELLELIMNAMCLVLERDSSLSDMGIEKPKEGVIPLPSELQKGLHDFNLVTHNFGVKAILAAYRAVDLKVQDNQKPNNSDLGSSCASN